MRGSLYNPAPRVPLNLTIQGGGTLYVMPSSIVASGNTTTPTVDQLYGMPVYVGRRLTVDQIGIQVTTGAVGGGGTFAKAKMAIYRDNLGAPGALFLDCGEVTTLNTTGFKSVAIANTVLEPGWYWTAVAFDWDYSTGAVVRTGTGNTDGVVMGTNSTSPNAATVMMTHYTVAWTYPAGANPAAPDPFPASPSIQAGGSAVPQLLLRVQ